MDTQTTKKTSPRRFSQSSLLANQAMLEKEKYGTVIVLCPKCHTHPTVTTTSKGERTTVRCKCGYVLSGEINF